MFRFLCCGVAAISCISSAQAADPVIKVTSGNISKSATVPTVQQARREVLKTPGAVAVVDAREFQDKYVLNFKDMLQETPGVFAQTRWNEEVRLSIRGSGLSRGFHMRGIQLLQDGVPFNLADGSADFQEIDPLLAQHIEVYRGGNALQFGATNLGGAINVVTPSALNVPYNYLLRAEGGSFGTVRLHGATAQKFGPADAYAAFTKSNSDGFRTHSEQNNQRSYANIGTKLTDKIETRFYFNQNDINQEIPGTLLREDALHHPKRAVPINIINDYARDIDSRRIANKTSFTLPQNWKLDIGAFLNDRDLYHPIFQVIDQKSLDKGGFGTLNGALDLAAHRNEILFGLNGQTGHTDSLRFINVNGRRGVKTVDTDQDAHTWVAFGENRFFVVPDVALVLGGQYFDASRKLSDNFNPANSGSRDYKGFNPKLGVLWNVNPMTQVFANVTKGTEVPTFSELVQAPVVGFVPLSAQDATTYEIGTRGSAGKFSFDATLFRAEIEDELLQFTVAQDIPASTFNADKTVHQGLELGLGYEFTEWLSLNGVYNYSDFRFDDDAQFGDNRLPVIPKHFIFLKTDIRPTEKLTISPNLEWVPTGPQVDFANNLDAPGYHLFGLNARYQFNDHVEMFLDARNLTDEKAITNFSSITDATVAPTNVFYPADGRSVFGGITVKF